MTSLTRPSVWRAYERLDARIREAARRAFHLFVSNPQHPSLHFKKLGGYDDIGSVRINEQYRANGQRQGDTIVWVWVGTHMISTTSLDEISPRLSNAAERPLESHRLSA